VLQTLFELLTREGQWEEARAVLDGIGREKLLDEPLLRRRRAIVLHMLAQQWRQQGRTAEALTAQRRALKLAPDFTPAALAIAELATAAGKPRQARKALESAWAAEPQPAIAAAWEALQPVDNPTRRYEQLRALERLRPDSVLVQLVMGEAAIAARRLDDARRHLDQAIALGPSVRGYQALAELERAAGEPEKARDWLSRVADAPPDRAWVCDDTGEVLPAWAPFGASGAFDVVHWGEPPRLATLLPADRSLTSLVEGTAPTPDTRRLPPRMPVPDMSTAATD
jgi:HemY protein